MARRRRWSAGPVPAIPAGGWQAGGARLVPMRRPRVIGLASYQPVRGVPLQPANGQALVSAGGAATVQLGPAGLGNIWYPTQVTVATTTGITTGIDSAVCNVYLGPQVSPATLLGTIFGGNGILAAALPNIQPGQFLIAVWSNGHSGDTAAMNVQGSMDALG